MRSSWYASNHSARAFYEANSSSSPRTVLSKVGLCSPAQPWGSHRSPCFNEEPGSLLSPMSWKACLGPLHVGEPNSAAPSSLPAGTQLLSVSPSVEHSVPGEDGRATFLGGPPLVNPQLHLT